MSWLKRKNKQAPEEPETPGAGQSEAIRALDKAEAGLERVQGETREILSAVRELKKLGEKNDFAARIREAMGG